MNSTILEDFGQFRREPSKDSRLKLVSNICLRFNNDAFKEQEAEIVKEILSHLSKDVEKNVRKVIAEILKENDALPHDIAKRLAQDVIEVSMPILEFSSVLTDDDLEEIIKCSENIEKMSAIARRDGISEKVSISLVNSKNESVVTTLVTNKTANLTEKSSNLVLEIFKESETVLESLISRGGLTPAIAEKMVFMVSAKLRQEISNKYHIKPEIMSQAVIKSREKITLSSISKKSKNLGKVNLVNHLHKSGRLNHSIVLRSLCRADLEFFELGIAKLASVSAYNASCLIRKKDKKQFNTLYKEAKMPLTMIEAVGVLVNLIIDNPKEESQSDVSYARHLVECIMKSKYDQTIPNMRYFIALINNSASDR